MIPVVDCDRDCSRSLWLLCSFQGSPEAYARRYDARVRGMRGEHPARAGLSKLNSMPGCVVGAPQEGRSDAVAQSGSVDVLGPTAARTARDGPAAPPGRLTALPRKEVIQPQLPLRLPCYDFTPVTSPTFDGSLPCGLGHRLRVLLTPVV